MNKLKAFVTIIALALTLGLVSAAYAAMTVQPVVLDLRMVGRNTGGQIRVENTGTNPLPVEIRLLEANLRLDGVGASDRLTEDLVAIPSQAIIPPGATQAFRIQYVGNPEAPTSRHYYAEVAQTPVAVSGGQSTIQVLYNFQAMVNVASAVAGPPVLSIESAEIAHPTAAGPARIAFTVHNAGPNYGYLSNSAITLVQRNAAGQELFRRTMSGSDIQQQIGFGLVGPNTSRKFVAPIDLPSGDGTAEVRMSRSAR
jgi:fimbrial chaperone protein